MRISKPLLLIDYAKVTTGLIKQPKWGHLKDLHAAVKSCSEPLLYGTQTTLSLGSQQQVIKNEDFSTYFPYFFLTSTLNRRKQKKNQYYVSNQVIIFSPLFFRLMFSKAPRNVLPSWKIVDLKMS